MTIASTGKKLRAFTKETPNAAVYADPRMMGSIFCAVFLKPVEDDLTYWQQRRVPSRTFRIPDVRKNDLERILDQEIADAVRDLSPALRAVK